LRRIRRSPNRCAALSSLLIALLGAPPDAQAGSAARDGSTAESWQVDVEPWLRVQIQCDDLPSLLARVVERGGYLKLVLASHGAEFPEPADFVFVGGINPNVRLLDVNGDGLRDATADVDIFRLFWSAASLVDPLEVAASDANLGAEARVGAIAYDFLGRELGAAWAESPVLLEAPGDGEEPIPVLLPGLPLPPAAGPCANGADDDGDGWIDYQDPDCRPGARLLENSIGTATCNDGIDNDGDGMADAADPGCSWGGDLSELPSCEDGLDDDGDGWLDSADPDCGDGGAGSESGFGATGCNDGVDGDLDGWIDELDADCGDGAGANAD
jgi:hypothetical protein